MFDKRYSTNTVANEISLEIQIILWNLIDKGKREGRELDYIQVFELSTECAIGRAFQKIVHKQEVPPLIEETYYHIYRPIHTTLWIVDNEDKDGNAVLLYPSEY